MLCVTQAQIRPEDSDERAEFVRSAVKCLIAITFLEHDSTLSDAALEVAVTLAQEYIYVHPDTTLAELLDFIDVSKRVVGE